MDFEKVAILGGGLLGGSIALALRERFPETPVTLWSRRPESVDAARARGIDGADTDLGICLDGATLVILGTPVGVMPGLIRVALEQGMRQGALVTDVGSVKVPPHREVAPLLQGTGVSFIGSHPMAGSERTGIDAASSSLFEGAACLLTDDESVGEPLADRLARFWQALGCRTHWITASRHDALVARISHFPHAVAAAATLVALQEPGDAAFAGGGLRDTTRVASGDPDMWAEIFMENRAELEVAVERHISGMSEMLAMLRAGDHEALRHWLASAKEVRQVLRRDL